MTILETAYETLKRCDRTQSQYDFSANWCGKSRSYLSWLKSADANPSVQSLATLLFRINAEMEKLKAAPDMEFPEVTEHDLKKLEDLKSLVTSELERHCLVV